MIFGQIPNTNVGINSDNRTMYSRRDTSCADPRDNSAEPSGRTSGAGTRYGLNAPKQIRLNSQIEYPAEKTIPELISKPTTGLRIKVPFNAKNSPIQLAVAGVPMFATVNAKKSAANIGMYEVIPR